MGNHRMEWVGKLEGKTKVRFVPISDHDHGRVDKRKVFADNEFLLYVDLDAPQTLLYVKESEVYEADKRFSLEPFGYGYDVARFLRFVFPRKKIVVEDAPEESRNELPEWIVEKYREL